MEKLWRVVGWRRLAVTGLCLAAWRALEQVTLPGANPAMIAARLEAVDTSSLIHAIGAGSIVLNKYSIVAMGIGPYVNALVIVWLLELCSRRLRAMGDTDDGKLRITRWTRALAVVLALGQAYGWTVLFQSNSILPSPMDLFPRLLVCLELAAGTMLLVLIADILDEFGLGLGNGAFLIYALTPLAIEVHRVADMFASAPSIQALYLPFGIWVTVSIAVVALSIAVLNAVRRVRVTEGKKTKPAERVELSVLMSGVLRPPAFALALWSVPVIVAVNYSGSNPALSRWVNDYISMYGPDPWADVANVIVVSLLVIGFTYFVVAGDVRLGKPLSRGLIPHIRRLALIGGALLAFTVVVLPVLERNASHAAGRGFGLSGNDAALLVAITVAILAGLERAAGIRSPLRVPTSRLP